MAADVTYDNAESGLDADNVQEAVDELADVVGDVAAEVGSAVSYDAQSKTEAQKDQARANIGAAAKEPHPYAYDGVNLKEISGTRTRCIPRSKPRTTATFIMETTTP